MKYESKEGHLQSLQHQKNTDFLRIRILTSDELDLVCQARGLTNYELYQKYGVQLSRKIREIRKFIQSF